MASSSSSSRQVLSGRNQDPEHAQVQEQPVKECMHRTKAVQFLGRTTPIILQNDNGPCPLLAICNVLLLRNNLKLSPDITEVSQEKLLSLVAEKLIDSNINVNNNDADYVQNQQQNIADAIDLLPRLATGIDVNLKFRRIDDFEFTRECAIFDLLDIPLYHGWIVDPQDYDTADALGSKSYNALMGALVALETRNEGQRKCTLEGDSVDFVAATTATLGVPSPNLSKSRSFGDSPRSISDNQAQRKGDLEKEAELLKALKLPEAGSISDNQTQRKEDLEEEADLLRTLKLSEAGSISENQTQRKEVLEEEAELLRALKLSEAGSISDDKTQRKGDIEEEAELLRALKLSEVDSPLKSDPVVGHVSGETLSASLDEKKCNKEVIAVENNELHKPEPSLPDDCTGSGKNSNEQRSSASTLREAVKLSLKTDAVKDLGQSTCMRPEESMGHSDVVEKNSVDTLVQNESSALLSPKKNSLSLHGSHAHVLGGDEKIHNQSTLTISDHEASEKPHGSNATRLFCFSEIHTNTDLSNGQIQQTDASEALVTGVEGSEPIYEGEECVLGARTVHFENREPVYEGEVVLAEQADKSTSADTDLGFKNEITTQQGELIRSFLRSNASQLTFYGLFCLQDGLKERELCVFFRNNHFSAMFKFKDELYLLATDQGFISQPDLVWEKLNEVNGDTLFMTSNFKEFVVENRENNSWNEHNALNSTADYLATLDAGHINSDLQLAIALQQQEFDQQPLRDNPQEISSGGGSSRLVTGPQVAGNTGRLSTSSSSPKDEGKSKERCIVM